MTSLTISPQQIRTELLLREEIALLDLRHEAEFATGHPLFARSDEELFRESWEALKVIAPQLRDGDVMAHRVFRAPYAQAICPTGFLNMLPQQPGPVAGLHLLDSVFLYPEDRTQSGLILRANAAARAIEETGQ